MKTIKLLLTVAGAGLVACAAVEPHEKADSVTLVKPEHVIGCEKLATTNVGVTHKVGIVTRGEETVTEDLINLAKSRAIELGGNTIVEKEPASEGKASFDVYNCVK